MYSCARQLLYTRRLRYVACKVTINHFAYVHIHTLCSTLCCWSGKNTNFQKLSAHPPHIKETQFQIKLRTFFHIAHNDHYYIHMQHVFSQCIYRHILAIYRHILIYIAIYYRALNDTTPRRNCYQPQQWNVSPPCGGLCVFFFFFCVKLRLGHHKYSPLLIYLKLLPRATIRRAARISSSVQQVLRIALWSFYARARICIKEVKSNRIIWKLFTIPHK